MEGKISAGFRIAIVGVLAITFITIGSLVGISSASSTIRVIAIVALGIIASSINT